jgi:hypothetical protein
MKGWVANLNKNRIIKNRKPGNNTFFITWEKVYRVLKAESHQNISHSEWFVLLQNSIIEILTPQKQITRLSPWRGSVITKFKCGNTNHP